MARSGDVSSRTGAEPTAHRLVAEARAQFARKGFAATSLDDVVSACGLTKGAFYHHFSSKTELFAAVYEAEQRDLAERVAAAAAAETDPWQGVLRAIGAYLDAESDSRAQRITMMDAPSVIGWEVMRDVQAGYGLALVKSSIAQLRDAGLIGEHNEDVLAHLLLSALVESALMVTQAEDPAAARQKVEHELRALFRGLLTPSA